MKSTAGEAAAGGTAGSGTAGSITAKMPPIGFVSTIAADELYDALKGTVAFSSMDKEKPGNPIIVRTARDPKYAELQAEYHYYYAHE